LIFLDLFENLHLWDETIQIYNDSFPDWEREDPADIYNRVKTKKYKMVVLIHNNSVGGFYILDTNEQLNYTLFTFLAVKESIRGKGLGTKLCLNAIEYFKNNLNTHFLLIEAQDSQAKLYSKLGFKEIDIKYFVPHYNSEKSIQMHLLCITKNKTLSSDMLKNIIKDIFICGYYLKDDDTRIAKQLELIPKRIVFAH